ncbi:MAG: hypothetical protein GYB31_00790 [Bacteroidetes bacterium]|nr:hypothetical protein [Bacteroidota bacterium]
MSINLARFSRAISTTRLRRVLNQTRIKRIKRIKPVQRHTNLPFFQLFLRLRNSGLMLELEDYYDLLEAMRGGFGVDIKREDQEAQLAAFRRMCKWLWIKNPAEDKIFEQQFKAWLASGESRELADKEARELKEAHQAKKDQEESLEQQKKQKQEADREAKKPSEPLEIPAPDLTYKEPENPYQPLRRSTLLSNQYYPLKHREMQQSWRHLHREERMGLSTELDVPATVHAFAQKGYLEKVRYLYHYQNQIDLSILVDVGGSMIAYDALCAELIRTAKEGGKVRNVSAWYFRNVPDDKIYQNPQRTEWIDFQDFVQQLDPMRSSVLIISDAGAARGSRSLKRLFQTETFLEEIRTKTLRTAWINPFPRRRWKGSSAQQVSEWVPMFYLNRMGLDLAIDVLKGKQIDQ